MKTLDIFELLKNHDQLSDVTVAGWARSVRFSNKIAFIALFDGTDSETVQVVAKEGFTSNFELLENLHTGAAVMVSGKIVLTKDRKQDFEIAAETVHVLKDASADFPLQKKEHSFEFLREIAHLRPRTATFHAVFKIRSEVTFAIHSFFHENRFVNVATPIITANDAEGAGESFTVSAGEGDFFGKKASLTVSGQLNAEAFAMAFKKVYTFGPTFRAEKSYTNRHAAEFWMVEPEIAFADLEQNMALAEALVKYLTEWVLDKCTKELVFLAAEKPGLVERMHSLVSAPFKRMRYEEAINALQKAMASGHSFENNDIRFGSDLGSEHERYLCEVLCNGPVFITHYPKEIKAFYMKQGTDPRVVNACDLLVPGIGEMVGGSQREDDYELLLQRCRESNIPTDDMMWYLNLRKYGYFKSAGFGFGLERFLMYVTGMDNIRDVIPFARTAGSIAF